MTATAEFEPGADMRPTVRYRCQVRPRCADEAGTTSEGAPMNPLESLPTLSTLTLLIGVIGAGFAVRSEAAPSCSVQAGASTTVIELYTSEGCSSCPPADRWLSTLKGRPDVVALAFHVNYWDQLGWPDRFASAVFTERQRQLMQPSGSRYVYTPQVIANGQDWRGWPALPKPAATASPSLTLSRDGDVVTAQVGAAAGSLSGYWAVVEDGHSSKVRAGENNGEFLRHDHVVRRYEPLPAWNAAEARQWQWNAPASPAANPRRVVFVVTQPATQKPVQAAQLAC
jgi:hypothetical protein